jgi:hypothetical protein
MNKKIFLSILAIVLVVATFLYVVKTTYNSSATIKVSLASSNTENYQCENTLAPFHEAVTSANGTVFNVDVGTPLNNGKTLSLADIPKSTYTDDYSLLQEAFKQAKQEGVSTLIIPQRTYEIHIPASLASTSVPIFNLSGIHNLIIDGQGSTFHFYDIHNAILINQADNVILKNLIIDWVPSLSAGGVLRHDAEKGTILQITTPLENSQWLFPLPITQLIEYDVADRKWNDSFPLEWSGSTSDPVNGFKYIGIYKGLPTYTAAHFSKIVDGTTFLATIRTNEYTAVSVLNSTNVSIENVDIYSSPGIGFGASHGNEGVMLCDSKVIRNPADSSRLISSTADASYFFGDKGNIAVLNNTFEFQGDDGVNVHAAFIPINSISSQSVIIDKDLAADIDVGDTIRFSSGKDLSTLFEATISSMSKTEQSCKANCSEQINFNKTLPQGITTNDYIIDLNHQGENYIVSGNTIENNRGAAILAQAENGLVEHNILGGNTLNGITLTADTSHFKEGPGADNVTVTNNTLSHIGYGSAERPPSGILVAGDVSNNGVISASANYPNQSLLIENNSLNDIPGTGILVESATNVKVEGNTFQNIDTTVQVSKSQDVEQAQP